MGNTHEPECYSIQRRMDQFDSLLNAEHSRIQEHITELSELRCELKADCQFRNRFERQLAKMEKRVMKLCTEMQDCRKYLLDSDFYLHQNEQRQSELQHRLQELWNLIAESCRFGEDLTVTTSYIPLAASAPKVMATTPLTVQPTIATTAPPATVP